jgi:hypothetical protein
MSSPHENPARRDLEAFLDRTLPPHVRESIAREVGRDRELRAEVELQERIDASLRRSFLAPAPPAALLAQLQRPAPTTKNARPRIGRRWLPLSVALAAVGLSWGYVAWNYVPRPKVRPAAQETLTLAAAYQQHVDRGFQPDLAGADEHAFAAAFFSRQGQGLLLRPLPEGSQLVGLAFSSGCGPGMTAIMARVDGAAVMVFVDRLDADTHPEPPATSAGLHMFRRELGPLVAYELSPLDKPSVVNALYPADVPPAPAVDGTRP